jgi:hypothetical protein
MDLISNHQEKGLGLIGAAEPHAIGLLGGHHLDPRREQGFFNHGSGHAHQEFFLILFERDAHQMRMVWHWSDHGHAIATLSLRNKAG